jgi:hypothetical protein
MFVSFAGQMAARYWSWRIRELIEDRNSNWK